MNDLQRRLLFILYRGCVEARLLAMGKQHKQIYELMDILELIPGCINQIHTDEKQSYIEIIRQSFKQYQQQFPSSCGNYIRILDIDEPPEFF